MIKPKPIHIADLLPDIHKRLIHLLEDLSEEDWSRSTTAPKWNVKDIAAHLLDGNLRALSMLRDNYFGENPGPIESYRDTVNFLDGLNADWIKASKRLSPSVIIELLKMSGPRYCQLMKTLDPDEKATFSVGWAGERESKNWFHLAREYTEKWHHQQQIRLAVGAEKELLEEKWFRPYLETSLRGLPFHYKTVAGKNGDLIKFIFRGESDKEWFLYFSKDKWELYTDVKQVPNCTVTIFDEYAWRIFTNGMKKEDAIQQSHIEGEISFGIPIFEMIAVMA